MMQRVLQENSAYAHEIHRIQAEYKRRIREISANSYSLVYPANFYLYAQRTRSVLKTLWNIGLAPLSGKEILEIGCGTGTWLVDFETFGADQTRLHGIDLDPYRSEKARTRLPAADIRVGDASNLPWPDEFFDLVLQSTVFTSILNLDMKRLIAAEMLRVLKPTGIILWYDFRYNNPKNANVRGIKAAEIRSLFKGCDIKLQTITLAPPIAKCLAKVSWITCLLLETIPALRTHYWGVIRKRPK